MGAFAGKSSIGFKLGQGVWVQVRAGRAVHAEMHIAKDQIESKLIESEFDLDRYRANNLWQGGNKE